ncbi:MAG: hypothetical protein QM756_37605 [Polyangiaceae bacterium]
MISGVAKLLGLGVPLLGSALHVEIGNHTEARARTSSTETTAEAETRGLLRLELLGKRNEFAVAYVPQLIVSPSQLSTREPAAFAYSTNHTLTLASDFRFKLTQIGLYQSAELRHSQLRPGSVLGNAPGDRSQRDAARPRR